MKNYWILVVLIAVAMGLYLVIYFPKLEKNWGSVKDSLYWQLVVAGVVGLLLFLSCITVPLMWGIIGILIIIGIFAFIKAKLSDGSMNLQGVISEDYNYKDYFWVVISLLTIVAILWSTAVWLD